MPRTSIVTAMYNHRPFLAERVASVLAQSERDWEWIIVDDCSTDGSFEEMARLTAGEPRIRLLRNEQNLGFTATTQRGIDLAGGEFLYRADSDDSSHPLFLAALGSVLSANPGVAVVASRALNLDAAGRAWGGFPRRPDLAETGITALTRFVLGNEACAPTLLYRRSAVDAAGGFASVPELRVNSDWNLTLGCLLHGDFRYVDWRLSYYRQHTTGISGSSIRRLDPEAMARERYLPLDHIFDQLEGHVLPANFPSRQAAIDESSRVLLGVCAARGGDPALAPQIERLRALIHQRSPGLVLAAPVRRRPVDRLRALVKAAAMRLLSEPVARHRRLPAAQVAPGFSG